MYQENFDLNKLREPVFSGQTRSEAWRRLQLRRIEKLIDQNENHILNSLAKDLGKPPTEAFFEVIATNQELKLAQKELTNWMRTKRVKVPLVLKPGEASIEMEPLGCVLIIGPWNYPFSLTIQPLISALAAGNTAVIKPSEFAMNTSKMIADLISQYFPKDVIQVIEGGGDVGSQLVEEPFDHIFFTGGSATGKKVMLGAAKNLTPITLELGGKSPAIVIEGADIEITAKRLAWGKSLNSGQTCIAPDYLIVEESLKIRLINSMKEALLNFYGERPLESSDSSKIINEYHFNRLNQLLINSRGKNQIIFGGEIDQATRKIGTTLINLEDTSDPLMAEELFGPLLPIITVKDLDSAINEIKKRSKPLAIYMFGGTQRQQKDLLEQTSSGGVCFNDVVMQAGIPELPFGGIGSSGIGKYHGLSGFETFSHKKSILKRPFWLDMSFRYPPYKLEIPFIKSLFR